jgi:hypothetical protein
MIMIAVMTNVPNVEKILIYHFIVSRIIYKKSTKKGNRLKDNNEGVKKIPLGLQIYRK